MDFEEFKQTKLYNVFAKPMKVQVAIYFLQKEMGGVPYSLLEKRLEKDMTPGELEISLNFWVELNQVDYDFDEYDSRDEEMYILQPEAQEGLSGLIELVTEAYERKQNPD